MRSMKWLATLLIAVLMLTACTGGGSGGSAGSGDGEVTIGLATAAVSTAFIMSLYYGVEDEANIQGANLVALDAGGYENSSQQIQQIQDLIQRQVDVIIVNVTNAEAVAPVVEQAIDAGIPVVGLSSLPKTDRMVATVGADHYGMGVLQAQCLAEKIGGAGDVAIMAGPAGVNWAMERVAGFKDTIAAEFPNINIIAEKNSNSDRNSGLTIMEDWLQAYPDLAGVATVVDDLGAGAADAIAAANKSGIMISSSNLSAIGRQYLEEDKIHCQSVQQGVQQGRIAVQLAMKVAKGETLDESKIITEALLITKEDLATVDMGLISSPPGYRPGN